MWILTVLTFIMTVDGLNNYSRTEKQLSVFTGHKSVMKIGFISVLI